MKITTQDNLLTHSKWWQSIGNEDNTLNLLSEDEDNNIFILNLATYDTPEEIESLNSALMNAFAYEADGVVEFSIPQWHEENIIK